MKRVLFGIAVVGAAVIPLGLGAGCGPSKATQSPADVLEKALQPSAAAAVLKALPGAHFSGTAMFAVLPTAALGQTKADEDDSDTHEAITTTTDLWLDRHGQWRLVENNDQDGGREIVRYEHDLSVALRYGKMIRRPIQEPEPTRYIEEAVGAPWAAWETVRRFAKVDRGAAPGEFKLSKSPTPLSVAASVGESTPLRKWRDTVQVQTLEGEARIDPKTGVLSSFIMKARFSAVREDKMALSGALAIAAKVDGIGKTPVITEPPSQPLQTRQRTILEERALLGNLNRTAAPKATP